MKKPDPDEDKEEIRKVLKELVDSTNDGDWDRTISIWEEQGVRMAPGAPAQEGVAEITKALKPSYEQLDFEAIIYSVDEVSVFGDIGITRCRASMSAKPKLGGDKINLGRDGKALTIYKRQPDGSWKIAYDIMNSNLPPDND